MTNNYRKDEKLKQRLNAFLIETFELPNADYYGKMEQKHFLGLKSVLSDINNALTMRLALGFIDWVRENLPLDEIECNQVRKKVLSTKPSANGYDVASLSFIAEVKCNVPVNGAERYGAAQKDGIIRDIESLLKGKSKAKPVKARCLKFMVFLDLREVHKANDHLIESNSKISKEFFILKPGDIPNNPDVVYGVYVPFNDLKL